MSIIERTDGAAEYLCAFDHQSAPLAINHEGQFPAVTLSFNFVREAHWEKR